jgi:hypothetical protein
MHGMPSDPNPWVGLFFLIFVFPLWLAGMGTFVYFWVHVAPSALRRWADDAGYQIIRRKNPGYHDWRSLASNSNTQPIYGRVYRVIVRDKMGESREGLVVVGGPGWYRMTVRRCPVEVRWDGAKPLAPAPSHLESKGLLWDRELD